MRSRPLNARAILRALAAVALLVAACSTASPATPAASPPPPVPLASRQIRLLEVDGSPDWLTSAFGSVWAKTDEGEVLRIDASTERIVARIDVDVNDAGLCQGLGSDGASIWTCSGADLIPVDPATNALGKPVPAHKIFAQGRLVGAAGGIWILTGENADQLVRIDSTTHELGSPIALGAACWDLAAGADAIWAACPPANVVLRIDPATSTVSDRIPVATPTQIAVGSDGVWVGSTDGIVRIGLADRKPVVAVPGLVAGDLGSVQASSAAVWVRTTVPFLTRIDPASSRVVDTIVAPGYDAGGDIIEADGTLWATDSDHGIVVHLWSGPG